MNNLPLESIRYSIPYICLVLYFILLYFTEYLVKKQDAYLVVNQQIIRLAAGGGLLLFFGFRGFIGWDWTIYYPTFQSVPSLFSLNEFDFGETRYEPGFVTLISFVKLFTHNYHFFIFINTLFDIAVLITLINQFSRISYALSCLVFIMFGGYYLEIDLLRNAKSIMLFLLSLKYLKERNILSYFILNIIGCLFHFSSLLYLPLYFFLHKQISKKIIIPIFIAGALLFLLQVEYIRPTILKIIPILGEKATVAVQKYFSDELYSSRYGITIGFAERMVTSLLILIYYNKLIKLDRDNILFINSFLIYFIFFFYFAEINIIPVRVGGLFSYAYWILYPALFTVIGNKNNKIIFLSFIFAYSLIKITGMSDTIFYKYKTVITGKDNYEKRLKIFESSKNYFLR